ncbi:unnamed protein product [Vitrella brassicaformis CCMP3155]|uniref:DJ-1/PfpI domain-containing protein n=1 Tax=Vitrella brassicaformis (strain CCMP3155) TaxID=1169540 RepID=A0A0G4H8T0_VITBC|nr:unnamed protein product [Vitrella brassicaformis CCMP3155]|mmetsp:Transcript_20108/g.48790  ORF Transcript_20108/g.48790 Transcript_20108/m.48790 type:complete len:188 (+) Transcript_20108:102-665(+)|eukprot:CEM40104.1 unnamed protein product [Vitrella brassicaformis CCMP3155]
MVKVLVPIANSSEEIETVCIVDTLRRAGADVTVASVEDSKLCVMSRKVKMEADVLIGECQGQDWDCLVLPGGMPGAESLSKCAALTELLKTQKQKDKHYAAICAAPAVVLAEHGLLEGHKAVCYPNPKFQAKLGSPEKDRVCVSGKCVTSIGPGSSLEFACKLVELLFDKEAADKQRDALQMPAAAR